MQQIEDIRQKYFMECKKIISDLLYIENAEDLAEHKYIIDNLLEKISFLKVMNENPEFFALRQERGTFVEENAHALELSAEEEAVFENDEKPNFTNEESKFEFANEVIQPEHIEHTEVEEILVEEEVREDISKISDEESAETEEIDETDEENTAEEIVSEELIEEATTSEGAYQKSVGQAETETEAGERLKIQEIEKPEAVSAKESYFEETLEHPHHKAEKKFKLPHIKGLKAIESLFDDDSLEHEAMHEEASGSLIKSNVPTDFMEAEKPKQEFKLDLNDRIAFSKMLFGGSQSEMNETVNTLNSFKTLDEAKEYLSDTYYQKNWKKADEYAQRLWLLVENKFQ